MYIKNTWLNPDIEAAAENAISLVIPKKKQNMIFLSVEKHFSSLVDASDVRQSWKVTHYMSN
jgi:hypothetical protein